MILDNKENNIDENQEIDKQSNNEKEEVSDTHQKKETKSRTGSNFKLLVD